MPLTADCTYKLAPEPRIDSFQDTSAYMFTGHERMTGGVLNAGQGRAGTMCEGGKKGDIKVLSARARPLLQISRCLTFIAEGTQQFLVSVDGSLFRS